MLTINPTRERTIPGRLPHNLNVWVDERALLRFVLEATSEGSSPDFPPNALSGGPGGCRPQVLLGILTYAYAIGAFSSEEIAWKISTEGSFRYLAANSQPTAFDLRQFRRRCRPVVKRSLVRLFCLAWESRMVANERDFLSGFDREFTGENTPSLALHHFANEAEERITRAVQLDSMDLDI
jgi:hypothetical protein